MSHLLKVCGLCRIADLRQAQRCGTDFVGLVIEAPRSPRAVSLAQAERLARLAPERVVAVVVSEELEFLREVTRRLRPRALQLHGAQAVALARELRELCPVWVAVGVPAQGAEGDSEEQALEQIVAAAAAGVEMIVLDTAAGGQTGGTGQTCDWEQAARIVARSPLPVLLAGGVCAENAAQALALVRPAGLDASSRLEVCPRVKDPAQVRRLGELVKGLEAES